MDAGPNVKVLCQRAGLDSVRRAVEELALPGVTTSLPGPGVQVTRDDR